MRKYRDIIERIGAEWLVVETFQAHAKARKFRNRLKAHLNKGAAYYAVSINYRSKTEIDVRARRQEGKRVLSDRERQALIDQWRPAIYAAAKKIKILPVGYERDDAVQAMMMAAWVATGTYDPDESSFSTHLYWQLKAAVARFITETRPTGYKTIPGQPTKYTFSDFRQNGDEDGDSLADWHADTDDHSFVDSEWPKLIAESGLSAWDKMIVTRLIIGRARPRDLAEEVGRCRQSIDQSRNKFFEWVRRHYDRDLKRITEAENDGDPG